MRTPNLQNPPSKISTAAEESLVAKDNGFLLSFGSLLVPVDFSPHSNETIKYAAGLAALTGANISILHVFQIPEYPAAFYYGLSLERETVKMHVEAAKREANAQLSLIAEELGSKGLSADPLLRSENPYEEIVNAAKELGVGLIVIGSDGHMGLERLLLGSTADRVVQYAPCPVLVVKDNATVPR
jgi:nucleotide-binding universal stress UspA family protein